MNSFFACAFIADEFDRGHDPFLILAALVERSLVKGSFVNFFQLSDLQDRVDQDWGITVPIIILKKQIYSLKKSGVVEVINDRKTGRKTYSLIANPAAEKAIDENETRADQKYHRVVEVIEAVREKTYIGESSEKLLGIWLDSNPTDIANYKPISKANSELKTASIVIAKAMGLDSKKNSEFINDLTDLVVGDQVYRAIHETTQLQSELSQDEIEGAFTQKMSEVDLFLDVGILARLRGHYGPEMETASIELLDMARALGAGIRRSVIQLRS